MGMEEGGGLPAGLSVEVSGFESKRRMVLWWIVAREDGGLFERLRSGPYEAICADAQERLAGVAKFAIHEHGVWEEGAPWARRSSRLRLAMLPECEAERRQEHWGKVASVLRWAGRWHCRHGRWLFADEPAPLWRQHRLDSAILLPAEDGKCRQLGARLMSADEAVEIEASLGAGARQAQVPKPALRI